MCFILKGNIELKLICVQQLNGLFSFTSEPAYNGKKGLCKFDTFAISDKNSANNDTLTLAGLRPRSYFNFVISIRWLFHFKF